MNKILLKFAFLAFAVMLLSAAAPQPKPQPSHASHVFVLARVYCPALPYGDPNKNVQTYIQGLKADTADFQVWPMFACISIPLKSYQERSNFFIPGKQFSADVSLQVTDKNKQPVIYKGALLFEEVNVYQSFKEFMAGYPGLHPKEGLQVKSLLLNFNPPDTSLQTFATNNQQTLMLVTFGPNFADGWPAEMKEGDIKFIRQILLERVE